MAEDADAFDVIVELLGGQRSHHRRNLAQRAVAIFLGEIDLDIEFHFALDRRGVEQNLMGAIGRPSAVLASAANCSAQRTSHG